MKPRANTLFISLSLTVLAALAGGLGFLAYASYAARADVASIQAAAREAAALAARQDALERTIESSRADFDAIDARFVREADVPAYIGALEQVAAASRVTATIGSISLGEAGEGGLKALRLRVDGAGTWADVAGFISALESLPYSLRIEAANVAKVTASEASGAWRFTADITQHVSP